MFRLVIIAAAISCTFGCTTANVQHHGHHSPSFETHYGSGNYGHHGRAGLGYPGGYPFYGYGYVYDPYQTGRFKAPDLLNDPYFRAQHKYDSHFQGRRSRRQPLLFRVFSAH